MVVGPREMTLWWRGWIGVAGSVGLPSGDSSGAAWWRLAGCVAHMGVRPTTRRGARGGGGTDEARIYSVEKLTPLARALASRGAPAGATAANWDCRARAVGPKADSPWCRVPVRWAPTLSGDS